MSKFITLTKGGKKYTINTSYIIRIDHKETPTVWVMSKGDISLSITPDQSAEEILDMISKE